MDLTTLAGRKELGTRLQAAIMSAGYASLPEFARQLGWSRALIYQYVNGSVLVQLDRLQQIAEHTGKTLTWLLDADPGADQAEVDALRTELAQANSQVQGLRDELAVERGSRLAETERHEVTALALLGDLCRALRRAGDAPGLVEAAARWQELARRRGDLRMKLQSGLQMGHGWFLQGELTRAEEVLRETVTTALELDQTALAHSARQELVRVCMQAGKIAEAQCEAEALAAADLWWPRWAGRLLLAAMAAQKMQFTVASEQLAAAEEIINSGQETAARYAIAVVYLLSNRVTVALVRGDYVQAAQLNDELRSLAGQAGAVDQLREAELNRALIALRSGDVTLASASLQLLANWAAVAQDARLTVLTKALRSELAARCGHVEEARNLGREALQQATETGQPHLVLEAHLALARAEGVAGRDDDAIYHQRQAKELAQAYGLTRLELQAEVLGATLTSQPERSWSELMAQLHEPDVKDLWVDALVAQEKLSALSEALAIARATNYFWGNEAALRRLTTLHLAHGDSCEANICLQEAEKLLATYLGDEPCPAIRGPWQELRQRLEENGVSGE